MNRLKQIVGCMSVLWIAASIAAAEPVFRAGAHAVDITPLKLPARIAGGFLEKTGTQITDKLHARCLVLDDGKTRIAFAIVDTCMMTRSLIDQAKKLTSEKCGIPIDRIMISATHTHSAPAAMACLGTRLDEDYAAWLPGKIAEGIAAADSRLQPAKIGWASIDDWQHTHNRRWIRKPESKIVDPFGNATGLANMHPGYQSPHVIGPSGPVDPGLSVICVQSRDGKPLMALANYSQHYFGSPAVSADYYGHFCKQLARLLGQEGDGNGPFVCAMSQGTSGDLMWMDYGSPVKKGSVEEYALSVAQYAANAIKEVKYQDHAELAMVEKKITLNYRVPDEKRLEWARPIAAKIENDLPKTQVEVYAREALILHERQKTEIVLQSIRIGELTIATLPNEVYALTGLKLKAQSPAAMHFNIELANGGEGYIPTPEQHVLGGYTTWPARTAGLEVQAEPKIIQTLLTALEEATGRKRRPMVDEHGDYAQAILNAKPLAYWRLNDAAGNVPANAIPNGPPAKLTDGYAWYLPGPGSGTGWGAGEKLTPSPFSGPRQINRAIHLAGGEFQSQPKDLGDHYTIALWFWLGEASGASDRSGTLILGPGGESLIARQDKNHRVQLELYGASTKQELHADDWHLALLIREGKEVRLHIDGQSKPAITRILAARDSPQPLILGRGIQGKLDEVALFSRVLSPTEIADLWKLAGIAPQQSAAPKPQIKIERPATAGAARTIEFPAGYDAAITALKPLIHAPLNRPPGGMTVQSNVRLASSTYATFNSGRVDGHLDKLPHAYSACFWFYNDTPNDARPVTAYLFSRGPDGDKQAPGDHIGISGKHRGNLTGRLLIFNGNAGAHSEVGKTLIKSGVWNHVVFIREGKRVRAYLNGGAAPEVDAEMELTAPAAKAIFLGARSDHFSPLQGGMAQFAFFDRALTPDEAHKLYANVSSTPLPTSAIPPAAPAAESNLEVQPALSPEDSLKKIHIAKGYEIELVAAEPLTIDPTAFDWDEKGRLWVVEMADYPLGMDGNGKPGGRIRILEDTDGDGKYDKSTLFAEGLNFPNGILTWRDGCIVTAAPDIVFMKDTDGDGKADFRQPILRGFFEGNQQLRVNGLRWGLDNWVHCAIGSPRPDYGPTAKIQSVKTGQEVLLGGRDFRFKPDTGEIDPLSGPSQFGRNRDPYGRWFGVQNSFPIWHYALEDRYLRRNPYVSPPNPRVMLTESNPQVFPASPPQKRYHSFAQGGHFTSACSATVYLDKLLFEDSPIQHAFTCEPVHNLVQHFLLEDDGVTFKARRDDSQATDFFASEDLWCRPVMVRTGPDGAIWVADMYRFMIEHPQFLPPNGRQELLPHYRKGDDKGRIYRIHPAGRRPAAFASIAGKTSDQLANQLESSNGWLRDKAQMMLLWRGDKNVIGSLEKLATNAANPLARLQSLCTLDGLDALTDSQLIKALGDPTAGIRENALRIAEKHGSDSVVAAAVKLVDDPDAKVRFQLAFSLGEWKQPAAGEALAALANRDPEHTLLRAAIASSLGPHLPVFTARCAKNPQLLEILFQTALGQQQNQLLLDILTPLFTSAEFSDLGSLQRITALLTLLDSKNLPLEKLAGQYASDSRWAALVRNKTRLLSQAKSKLAQASAKDQLKILSLLICDPAERSGAVDLIAANLATPTRRQSLKESIALLVQSGDPRVPQILLADWNQRTPAEREMLLDALMGREAWSLELLAKVKDGTLNRSSFDAQRQARLTSHPSKAIRQLASSIFMQTAESSRQKVVQAFQPALTLTGDPAKGKTLFSQACAACHLLEGVGKSIGPDLRSIVQHPADKLLVSILDPSADIQPGFNAYFCELKNGTQLYGIITSEAGASVTFKLPDASIRSVLRQDIQSLQGSKQSLMPDGLEAAFTAQSLADLIAYLKTPK